MKCKRWMVTHDTKRGQQLLERTAAGQQAQAVAPRHGAVDDLLLQRPERLEAEGGTQHLCQVRVPLEGALQLATLARWSEDGSVWLMNEQSTSQVPPVLQCKSLDARHAIRVDVSPVGLY